MRNSKPNFFKRNFATFLAKNDEESHHAHHIRKEKMFANLSGKVLEIGPGTGVNFTFFKRATIEWSGIEPNPAMHPFLFAAAKKNRIEATLLDCTSESICLPEDSMDFVISTEVLCSVNDLNQSLAEIHRVLKPDGRFLFLEHVVDKQNILRRTIQRIVPFTPWKFFSDGCHPCRDIGKAIKQTGFQQIEYTEYMRDGSGIIITINRPHISGWAIK